jgi:hypothetical protein
MEQTTMAITILQQNRTRVEIHVVFNFPFHFYSRYENGIQVIESRSITPERARQIYDENQGGQSMTEGKPFNDQGQAWAWSAWVTVGE